MLFPSVDTLRLALTSGAIPDAVRATAVKFAFDDAKALWIVPTAVLSATAEKDLRRLGVRFPRESKIDLLHEATNWLQIFPLTRDPHTLELGDKSPVLFELTKEGQLAEVATEILRLGNDRQSFRWLGDDGQTTTLLRVIGPPYYSLLRALDREGEDGAAIAYREVAPRLWIQLGYTHPLAEHLRPPAGQLLLMRPPHRWTFVPEAKLRDIYEVFDFQLPDDQSAWRDLQLPSRIQVPIKLTRSGAPEAAELWVLREEGIVQLEELVRASDNELLARLAFAVGENAGARVVVLRVGPSKGAPPVLILEGLALRSYLRIPNLFLPVGMALYPPLRREAVVKLLAGDKLHLTWLVPHDDNTFTPESLPDNAFRPLSEWIDYVLEHEHAAIKSWIGATQFDFEGFICKDEGEKTKKPPKNPSSSKPKKQHDKEGDDTDSQGQEIAVIEKKKSKKADSHVEEEIKVAPSELEKRLHELEGSFTALQTPLDDPQRLPLWIEMAQLNGALHHHGDAAVCWSNALWEQPRVQVQWPQTWFRLEAKQPIGQTPPTAQILRIVTSETPTHTNLRLLAAYLIWAGALPSPPAELRAHLNTIQQYFEKHEAFLGVRAAWLTWHAICQLSRGDVLMLARARDRMLERLYLHGLTPELDLPGFLRFAGMQASNRFHMVRDQVVRLRRVVQDWAKKGANPTPATHAYIDLIFAFGLARLGETPEAHKLREEASHTLQYADEVHSWLYEAFEYRLQQALDGKPGVDRLPEQMLKQLELIEHPEYLRNIEGEELSKAKNASRLQRFKIDRLRQYSHILEPQERIDSYARWHGADEITALFDELRQIHDRLELIQRLRKLVAGKEKFAKVRNPEARLLAGTLELALRLGQSFGEEMLDLVPIQIKKAKAQEDTALLLEKGIILAAHYDRKENVQQFVEQFNRLLEDSTLVWYEKLIPMVTGSFRSLRKFGLRDTVEQLMQRITQMVENDPALRTAMKANAASANRCKRLSLLLELASGWFFFGEQSKAQKILDEAREQIFGKELATVDLMKTSCAYLATLGNAPMEFALSRIMEFFRKVEGVYDNWTTHTHYSLSRLSVVEAMMLALISDDFTLDPEARKRLDDDEFLVRRRIHQDVRDAVAKSGM